MKRIDTRERPPVPGRTPSDRDAPTRPTMDVVEYLGDYMAENNVEIRDLPIVLKLMHAYKLHLLEQNNGEDKEAA